jgi:hypothetical protein
MNEAAATSLAKAARWLLAQQGMSGGWQSQTYGQLKEGAATTALAIEALSHLPTAAEQSSGTRAAIDKGFAFLDRGLAKRGTLAGPDGSLDFPTYAAALWLSARNRLKLEPSQHQAKVTEYLLGAQITEGRGFMPDSPSYGGWDFLGPGDAQGITTGTNISVTRYVLEGLTSELDRWRELNGSGSVTVLKQWRAAMGGGLNYVLRCQQEDGGFAFTCEPASLNNKAAYADDKLTRPRPYGTATCDGILALLACGIKPDDERLVKAIAWLTKRPSLELVPGFEGLPPELGWDRGLRYYYYAGLARVLPHFPASEIAPRSKQLAEHLAGLQIASGSFVNESDRMRENDPLIATPLAMMALARL